MLNPAFKILIENATSFQERGQIHALLENEVYKVNNTMISNLYKSALDKAHVDFEDIPNSKGDITKYSGFKSMIESIALLKEIFTKANIKITDLETVETAVNNIIAHRNLFEKGFSLEKEFIILQYNVLVFACVESVSTIISSFVDYVKRPDKVEFSIIKNARVSGWLCINNLEKFNLAVKKGELTKVLTTVINSGRENLTGKDLAIPALVIGAVLAIVPLMRELIFYFYYSRMKLSDYLKQQATFLEINKSNISSSTSMTLKKKNDILKKQDERIKLLRDLADKLQVNDKMREKKTINELKNENKNWTIDTVRKQSVNDDTEGYQIL